MDNDPVMLRSQAIIAADLAAKSRDPEVTKLLLIVSEQMEEEACELEMKRGDPKLEGPPLFLTSDQGVQSDQRGNN